MVRWVFVDQVSNDYRAFVGPWYDYLAAHGGFAAVGTDISNYNPPYLYLLAAATYLPLPKIVAIKAISVVFDVVLAGLAALIVREHVRGRWWWIGTFSAVLFAPTVVLNGASWGQCDSIYTAFTLGSLYFLIRRRPWLACLFFGLALSFKLQAVFFLPVLLIVVLVNRPRPVALLLTPAVFAMMLLPAAVAGRDWSALLWVYPNQVSSGGAGAGQGNGGVPFTGQRGSGFGGDSGTAGIGGGTGGSGSGGRLAGPASTSLTQNAPTFYQWVSGTSGFWKYLGLGVSGLFASAVMIGALVRRRPFSAAQIVVLAVTVVLVVPFFLPEMHERYFYLADVLTIVAAFYLRRYWLTEVVVSACSVLSYAPFLWQRTLVPLPLVAFAEFLTVIAAIVVYLDTVHGRGRLVRVSRTNAVRHPVEAPPTVVAEAR